MDNLIRQTKSLVPNKVWEYTPIVVVGLGSLWIVGKVGSKFVSKLSKRRML
jgi:hypothetical protein